MAYWLNTDNMKNSTLFFRRKKKKMFSNIIILPLPTEYLHSSYQLELMGYRFSRSFLPKNAIFDSGRWMVGCLP